MSEGHGHGHSHSHMRAGARHAGRLKVSLALVLGFLGVQVAVGFAAGSLALLSDAGHMATDALGLAMAVAAIGAASRATRSGHRTFGLYRLEILAALANAALLFGVAVYVVVEAVRRVDDPPEVASWSVLAVGVVGLVVNLVAFVLLREGSRESLAVRGAYAEVVADALGSVAVIVAALVLWITGWAWVDPVIGAAIAVMILPRAWGLGRESVRVLVQAAPPDIDLAAVTAALASVDGVVDVHDLHVWTLTSEMEVLTAHLGTTADADAHRVLSDARGLLAEQFHLSHATLQVEPADDGDCDDMTW